MEPITQEELQILFPDGLPMVGMKILFPEKSARLEIDEIRNILRALAYKPPEPDPPGYRAMMELMHRGVAEIRKAGGMSDRANALYELIWALEKEFPEARALIDQRWGSR